MEHAFREHVQTIQTIVLLVMLHLMDVMYVHPIMLKKLMEYVLLNVRLQIAFYA
jgi:hypothetical protein